VLHSRKTIFYKDIQIVPLGGNGSSASLPGKAQLPSFTKKKSTRGGASSSIPEPFGNWILDVRVKTKEDFLIKGNIAKGRVTADIAVKGTVAKPKPLGKALYSTKTDIKCSYIPDDVQGYLEFPDLVDADGDEIFGIFYHTSSQGMAREITLGYIVKDKTSGKVVPCMLNLFLKDEDLLKDVVSKFPYTNVNYSKPDEKLPAVLNRHLSAIVNAMIYIYHTNDVLSVEINNFTGSKKAQLRQKNLYSEQPYTLVGRGFELPRSFASEHIVSGHFKWQRYGFENSCIKHIYVDPYLRGPSLDLATCSLEQL